MELAIHEHPLIELPSLSIVFSEPEFSFAIKLVSYEVTVKPLTIGSFQ